VGTSRTVLVGAVAASSTLACTSSDFVGPRIVAWQLEADGAPPLVVGSYDAREKARCRFHEDDAGVLRCLPTTAADVRTTSTFADPACQTPIYLAARADAPALAARAGAVPLLRVDCERQRWAVATLKLAPTLTVRYGGEACTPMAQATTDTQVELVIDRTFAPDKWATATEVDGPLLGNGIRVRQIETAEGARFDDHLIDESIGKECHVEADVSSNHVCKPLVTSSSAHEGTDCMGPLAYGAPACSDPAFVAEGGTTYQVGPKWDGPVSNQGHGCSVLVEPLSGPQDYYEKGPEVAFEPPQLELQGVGSGRLELRGVLGDGGVVVLGDEIAPPTWWVTPRYFDHDANRDCDPVWTPEGLVRCIPTELVDAVDEPPWVGFYADAGCTEPVRLGAAPDGAIVVSAMGSADGELHAVALHAAVRSTKAYFKTGVACELVPGDYYTLGSDELPWDPYPEIREVNGPAPGTP
jgi:hypothetical protein